MPRAAEALYLAQSAVSTHVASLAAFAGGPLFERRFGKVVPTALGRELYDGAVALLAQAGELERRLRATADAASLVVNISCTHTVCETSVARIMAMFKAAHSEIPLAVTGGSVKEAEMRLRSGESDLALIEGNVALAAVRLVPFHVDRLRLAVPAGHPLATNRRVQMAEAEAYPFVLRTRASGTRLLIEQRLGARFERLSIVLELEGNDEIVTCVEAGIGVALLSETALQRALALRTIAALDVDDVDLTREFSLALPEDRTLGEPARIFAEWLTTCYAEARRELLTA